MSFHPSLLTPQAKAKKMMLWFGMISMTMMFAGLTSAYVVSKSRPDWLENFVLPVSFYMSSNLKSFECDTHPVRTFLDFA